MVTEGVAVRVCVCVGVAGGVCGRGVGVGVAGDICGRGVARTCVRGLCRANIFGSNSICVS